MINSFGKRGTTYLKYKPMSEKITLIENGKILSNDKEVAECFQEHFINITDGMGPSLKELYEI